MILSIWRNQPGKYFCISSKSRDGVWKDTFFRRRDFRESVQAFIDANVDKDLYFCPHGFKRPRRLKRFAEVPKLLWADLDEVDPGRLGALTPTIAWESSPGRYACLWVLDTFMTEDLNRRLTYFIGADPGGWDLTQVLRIPGTLNYKYAATPKVKLKWSDGKTYQFEEINKLVPDGARRTKSEKSAAFKIYRKYEAKLSGKVRRELLNGRPTPGKRSQVFWWLVQSLIEAGASSTECYELLRVSPWNKFAKRRDGDEQLKREIDKATTQHLRVEDDENPQTEAYGDDGGEEDDEDPPHIFLAKSMADVVEEEVDWVWYPYLAKGEVTILEGDPGLGKSYLAQMIAMGICDGNVLPSLRRHPAIKGKVAYFDIENSAGSVTKKRLVNNGIKNPGDFFQEEEPFSIDDDTTLDRVYHAVDRLRPTLIVFDTLNTYIGKADTHNSAETQQAFRHFVEMARRFHCAVLVLRHLTKSSKERALYRGQGSIAFTGLARIVLTVGLLPDDPSVRVVAVTKLNITRYPKALTFTIEALPDKGKESDRSRFVWGDYVDLTSDDIIIGRPTASPQVQEQSLGITFLKDMLADGPMPFVKLIAIGEGKAVSRRALEKAAEELGVIKDDGFWSLR